MLTQEQLDKLNTAIRHHSEISNPLARLIQASQHAGINLQDVLEHLIVQALDNAYQCDPPGTQDQAVVC